MTKAPECVIIAPNFFQDDRLTVVSRREGQWKFEDYGPTVTSLALRSSIIRGIPAPVLIRNPADGFILHQRIRSRNGFDYLVASRKSGLDVTGRHVFLTTVVADGTILDASDRRHIVESVAERFATLSKALNADQQSAFREAVDRCLEPEEIQCLAIKAVEKAASTYPQFSHFTNVSMEGLHTTPDSEAACFEKKIFQLPSPIERLLPSAKITVLLFALLLLLCAGLYLASSDASSNASAQKIAPPQGIPPGEGDVPISGNGSDPAKHK